jgi:cytochrome c
MLRLPACLALLAGFLISVAPPQTHGADLRGHGGPVSALAVSGPFVLSGAFDTRVILWDRERAVALKVLRLHEGNVTATAFLPDGGYASGGQDGRVALWPQKGNEPWRVTHEHQAPVAGLALSPGGATLAAGGWDGRLQFLTPATGDVAVIDAHRGMVTGLGYLPDGRLVSVGSDLRLMIWQGARAVAAIGLPASPNGLAIVADKVAVIFSDGGIRLFDAAGLVAERTLTERPLVAVAAGGDAIAAASVDGNVWVLEAADLATRHALQPAQGPVWSLALTQTEILTGGGDGLIRRWDLASAEPLGAGATGNTARASFDDGSRGAEVWRACALCHSLTPDDGNRAGPTLHAIFGRRIGTAENYDYSDALRKMDIVWTPQTVAELFEVGPDAYTPGSRMPDQRVPAAADRAALVEFLARATR